MQLSSNYAPKLTELPIGTLIETFNGDKVPKGWIRAEGQMLLRKDYPELFVIMNMTYCFTLLNDRFFLPNLCNPVQTVIIKALENN
jgi:microcystin-dependent protein